MGRHLFKFMVLSLILGGLFSARNARAAQIIFDFTAQVIESEGTENFTGGVVAPGSTVTGSVTFDSNATDLNPDPNTGLYIYKTPSYTSPIGMSVHLGTNVLESNPSDLFLFFDVANDVPQDPFPDLDQYHINSTHNLPPPLPTGHAGNITGIEILMVDDELGFSSGALPLTPPHVSTPDGTQNIFIHGNDNLSEIFLQATLTSFTVRTAESSLTQLKELFEGLPTDVFKSGNMKNAMGNKIDAALAQLALIESETNPDAKAALIADLRDKLTNDILGKSNGCGTDPDKNDWVIDCSSQASVQALVQQTLDLLDTL